MSARPDPAALTHVDVAKIAAGNSELDYKRESAPPLRRSPGGEHVPSIFVADACGGCLPVPRVERMKKHGHIEALRDCPYGVPEPGE